MAEGIPSRIFTELDAILTAAAGTDTRIDTLESLVYLDVHNALANGQGTLPRSLASSGAAATIATGSLRLTYFTAMKSFTSASVTTYTGPTAAAATPTLCRVGLYAVAVNGDLTLAASTPNDAALWNAAGGTFNKAWSAPVALTAGARYALGILCVTAAAAPSMPGVQIGAGQAFSAALAALSPRLTGNLNAQSDLPLSVSSGSVLSTTTGLIYSTLLP